MRRKKKKARKKKKGEGKGRWERDILLPGFKKRPSLPMRQALQHIAN